MGVDRYTVEHETRYAYRVPVSQSWQLAHLTPRELPWQHVLSHELRIEPATDERRDERDDFGNDVTHFAVYGPHPLLRVLMLSRVEVSERPDAAPVFLCPLAAFSPAARIQLGDKLSLTP